MKNDLNITTPSQRDKEGDRKENKQGTSMQVVVIRGSNKVGARRDRKGREGRGGVARLRERLKKKKTNVTSFEGLYSPVCRVLLRPFLFFPLRYPRTYIRREARCREKILRGVQGRIGKEREGNEEESGKERGCKSKKKD